VTRGRADTSTDISDRRGSLWASVLVGVGLMAAVEEIVFHQLLQWHHFDDRATAAWGVFADGLMHALELVAVVGGFVWMLRLQSRGALRGATAWAGLALGSGGYQLFDGVVLHRILGLHRIRYGVDLLPYDLAWNGAAVVLLALGALLLRRARRR